MIRLPCCVEVHPRYAPKARHALTTLLEPLGIEPNWVDRSGLSGVGVFYGRSIQGLSDSVITLSLGSGVEDYYSQRKPLDLRAIRWRHQDNLRFPVLFGEGATDDLVASTFFWISEWQQYVTTERDIHGRFPHSASLQSALGTTMLPVVDIYRRRLQLELRQAGLPAVQRVWGGSDWVFCPTIDVDYIRKWRKGIVYRELVEYALLNFQRQSMPSRLKRLRQSMGQAISRPDPFRSALGRMLTNIARNGSGTVFLKAGAHGSRDVHYSLQSRYLKALTDRCRQAGVEIGLHPSYFAHTHPHYMRQERAALTELTGRTPNSVRQHYLRCESSFTQRLQATSGFRIDSTLGFATYAGFRNGTCMPFRIFDVDANRALDLWEFPLAVMDSALFNRQKLTPDQAINQTKAVLSQCKEFGGVGVVLWHNVLWDEIDFPGWGRHFESIMEWTMGSGARTMSLEGAFEMWRGYPMGTQLT